MVSSPKPTHKRSCVFIRERYSFNSNYIEKFKSESILDVIPSDNKSVRRINKKAQKIFPNWPEDLKSFCDKRGNDYELVYVKDESYFEGFWRTKFEVTNVEEFRIGRYARAVLPMMKTYTIKEIFIYRDGIKGCDFIHLPYSNGYGMLIIMPRRAKSRRKLFEFCVEKISQTFTILMEKCTRVAR